MEALVLVSGPSPDSGGNRVLFSPEDLREGPRYERVLRTVEVVAVRRLGETGNPAIISLGIPGDLHVSMGVET